MKKVLKSVGIPILGILIITGFVYLMLNIFIHNDDSASTSKASSGQTKTEQVSLIAIGDSLTEGIGDATDQGGYVPLIKNKLEDNYDVNVTTVNDGIAGETSAQILKRITNSKKIQNQITDAQVITMTFGGNDLMNVLKKNALNFSKAQVVSAQKKYNQQVEEIMKLIRSKNSSVPIFIFGIYNPFYVYFPKVTILQDSVDNWNKVTQALAKKQENTYFVDISELSNGDKLQQETKKKSSSATDSSDSMNSFIFEGDNFHPNNKGYQVMTDNLYTQMKNHEKTWFK